MHVERGQLLAHWTKVMRGRTCWLTTPFTQMGPVFAPMQTDRPMKIRKLHDKLGYCAKGTVARGGLCAGAIYRTGSFVKLPQERRSGARASQTVHIEHTVPVGQLSEEFEAEIISKSLPFDVGLAWLLKHSVTTAMEKGQDSDYLRGVTRSTEAFDKRSPAFGRPFLRYGRLFDPGETVWDVWHQRPVDPEALTFDRNFATVLDLLKSAGADASFIRRLRAVA